MDYVTINKKTGGEKTVAEKKKNGLRRHFKPKMGTIIVTLALLIFVGTLFGTNAMKIHQLNAQKADIQSKLDEAEKKSKQLDEDIKQIGTKNYIELIARKYLGLYYPDEKIVVPVEGKDNNGQNNNEQPAEQPTPTTDESSQDHANSDEQQSEENE